MQVAIVVNPTDGVPLEKTSERMRQLLSSDTAGRRVISIPRGAGIASALLGTLDLYAARSSDAMLVVLAEQHLVLDGPEATAIGLDDALAQATEAVDQELDRWMSVGYRAMNDGDRQTARERYVAVDEQMGPEVSPRRALVLVSLGDIARAEGRLEEAVTWFDRALAIAPTHIGALRGRSALALEGGESAIAAALLHRLVDSLETDTERTETLLTIASQSLTAARDAIGRALVLCPHDRSLLERLRAVHEASGQWDAAIGVAVELAEITHDVPQRARSLAEAARLCSRRTGNTARAVALYEAAIEDDPQVPGAFQAIEQELLRAQDYGGVASAYERQLERLRHTDAHDERSRLLRQLVEVQRDRLGDVQAALSALARLIELAPHDAHSRIAQAELFASTGQTESAVIALEGAAEVSPTRVETYRMLYELFAASRDEDRVYSACAALVALGEADINEQMTYAQHSPSAALVTRQRFDATVWKDLAPLEHQDELDRVAAALETAAIDVWLGEHRDRSEPKINERLRQHPTKTTVSAVRCAVWAADLLGVSQPAIYAQPESDRISVATLPVREHALLLGRHVLAGRSVPELSFILARHLSYSRPGWRILMFYPELRDLEPLVRASLALALPGMPGLRDLDPRANQLKSLLEPLLGRSALTAIGEAVQRLLLRDARLDLLAWTRSVETTACRAALLACGDTTAVSTALAVSGVTAGGVSAKDRALGLLPFSVSRRHAALRRLLGVAAA